MKYFMLKFAISGMGGIISSKKDLKMLWFAYTFYFNILTNGLSSQTSKDGRVNFTIFLSKS